MTPQPSEQPPGLWNELHRTLHEPGPTIVITKGQAAYLLERIARAEAAAPDPLNLRGTCMIPICAMSVRRCDGGTT